MNFSKLDIDKDEGEKKLEEGVTAKYNKRQKQYFIQGPKKKGFRAYTFYAAVMNYPYPQYLAPAAYFSTIAFQGQVWTYPLRKGNDDHIPEVTTRYKGLIPLRVLEKMLNDRLNAQPVEVKDGQDEFIGGVDYKDVYKNWSYRYDIGYFYYDENNMRKNVILATMKRERGNAPTRSFTKQERQAFLSK